MPEPIETRHTTRKLPFPITLPSGRVGRGHLLPDLFFAGEPSGFVRVPGGKRVKYGMIGFVGQEIGVADMLERWEREVGPVTDREAARVLLLAYVDAIAALKLGNVVSVEYSAGGVLRLKKISEAPPGGFRPKLPK